MRFSGPSNQPLLCICYLGRPDGCRTSRKKARKWSYAIATSSVPHCTPYTGRSSNLCSVKAIFKPRARAWCWRLQETGCLCPFTSLACAVADWLGCSIGGCQKPPFEIYNPNAVYGQLRRPHTAQPPRRCALTHLLPDAVHGQLRDAAVHGAAAQRRGQDGPDGGAARHVVAYRELLHAVRHGTARVGVQNRRSLG